MSGSMPTVLIAERIYSGLFPIRVFQDEIAKWASADGSFLNYVLFSDKYTGGQFLTKSQCGVSGFRWYYLSRYI